MCFLVSTWLCSELLELPTPSFWAVSVYFQERGLPPLSSSVDCYGTSAAVKLSKQT